MRIQVSASVQDVRSAVEALTEPTVTVEMIPGLQPRFHRVEHPSLLDQLRDGTMGAGSGTAATSTVFGSQPPARLDCVDVLSTIERGVAAMARERSWRMKRGPIEQQLAELPVLAVHDPEGRQLALSSLRGWEAAARAVVGLADRVLTPDVRCPVVECERLGTLRVTVAERVAAVTGAYCTSCHTAWTDGQLSVLIQWVEWASLHLRGSRHMVPAAVEVVPAGPVSLRSWGPPRRFREDCQTCLGERLGMDERRRERELMARGRKLSRAMGATA